MADKPKPEPDDKEQSQRFIDTARELQVDESGKHFAQGLNAVLAPNKQDTQQIKPKKA